MSSWTVAGLRIAHRCVPALEMQINNLPGVVTCWLFGTQPGADIALLATQQGIRRLTRP